MKRLHAILIIAVLGATAGLSSSAGGTDGQATPAAHQFESDGPPVRLAAAAAESADWQGVDDKFEEIAKAAGHPAREPYINLVQGDLGLFVFLVAGAVGGFVAGYSFRILFPPRIAAMKDHAPNS